MINLRVLRSNSNHSKAQLSYSNEGKKQQKENSNKKPDSNFQKQHKDIAATNVDK